MTQQALRLTLLIAVLFNIAACNRDKSIYQGLAPEEDGTIAVGIPDEEDEIVNSPVVDFVQDELAPEEHELVDRLHEGEYDQLSFFVVEVESSKIIKSYQADLPQRLASVSKIPVSLAALENVRNVEVSKVQDMLKISNNGEASRYVRLAAKALKGTVIPTAAYKDAHSCPDEFLNDQPAADVVYKWIMLELPQVNWTGASLNDGAGCHYDNFMNSVQVSKILQLADSKGKVFDGKDYEELLSINGVDGTLVNKNLDHKGYIFGKTGTLNPNANLSGYFYARRNGKQVKHYFSIFINKKGGGEYSTKARSLIEGLLRYWINYYSVNEGVSLGTF